MVFEVLSYGYSEALTAVRRVWQIEKETFKSARDPGTFISGAVAGAVGRAAVLPFDKGGAKGVAQTIGRRVPQMGFLMMFYCPVASRVLPGTEKNPPGKMAITFLVGAMAGLNMRLITNPISRVLDEMKRTGKPPKDVIKMLQKKTILQFWYTTPNLLSNALYFGMLFTVFEGLRRFTERNVLPIKINVPEGEEAHQEVAEKVVPAFSRIPSVDKNYNAHNYLTTAVTNCVLGGTAAAIASTVCYPFSAHQYMQTVIHDSALCRGLMPTLVKEVPMIAVMFGTFSLIQPFLAPRHGTRCGFGY